MQPPIQIPLGQLQASPTNPRKHFDEGKLRELAANIAQHGVLQALLVRPVWCEGCATQAQLEARRARVAAKSVAEGERYEIVDGERRFRAMKLHLLPEHADDAAAATLPCDVRELTDTQVVEIQLITFLLKEPLTPLEEAKGFADLLGLKDDKGAPLHTRETIAKEVSRPTEYVHRRIKLLKAPASIVAALEAGVIGVFIAEIIARIPAKEEREKAARAVLGEGGREPMTTRAAERYIAENFMQELKGAPFNTEDATLRGPTDGKPQACTDCPYRTGNNKELFGDVKRGDICTNPPCYREKCRIVFEKNAAAAVAGDKSVKVLGAGEAEEIFAAHDRTSLRFDTKYVDVHEKPAEGFVKHGVDRAKLPVWERLMEGRDVPRVVVQDGSGRMRTLVERSLAIAAAKQNGDDIFVAGLAPGASKGKGAADKKADEAQKKQLEESIACAKAVRALVVRGTATVFPPGGGERLEMPLALLRPMLDLVMEATGADAMWFVLQSLGQKKPAHQTSEEFFRDVAHKADDHDAVGLLVELLYARQLRANPAKKVEAFVAIAKAVGADLTKAVEPPAKPKDKGKVADVKGALSAKAPAKGKPAKTTPEQQEEKVRELRAKGKTVTDIYLEAKISLPRVKTIVKKIDAEKGGKKK